jgi:CRP-like cAMP-binding protein
VARQLRRSNQLLDRLPRSCGEALVPHLRTVDLARDAVLHKPGEPFSAAYFPHDGVVALVIDLKSGHTIETATVGCDGVIGGAAGFGMVAVNRAIVHVSGHASMIQVRDFRLLFDRWSPLRDRVVAFQHFLLAQAQQCSACNARHPVEQRLVRWLLRCRDLTHWDDIPFTHELLAEMLGVQRPSVSIAANTLERTGLIEHRRGFIRLVDNERLRTSACECYEAINAYSERLLGHRPGSCP